MENNYKDLFSVREFHKLTKKYSVTKKKTVPQQKSRPLKRNCPMTKRAEGRKIFRNQGSRVLVLMKNTNPSFKEWKKNYCFIFRIIQRIV